MRIFADAKEVSPIDLEEFTYKYAKFPMEATPAVVEYLHSLKTEGDMAYMSISKERTKELNLSRQGINEAQSFLRDRYLRFIQGIHWGFIVRPDFELEDGWYVSFRSIKGYQEVAPIAEELGGGGHTYAAGLRIQAKTEAELLERILSVTRKYI
jgi:nanoRNase/pAp phosphatase (c-di-AMP/oligoRNAs hydrolase)